jgi:hypothetical protein
MQVPVLTALAGLGLVLGSWITYMATVPSGKVPARPLGHLTAQAAGGLLALWSIASSVGTDVGVLRPALAGGMAVTMSGLFFFLYSQRATPVGKLAMKVGDMLRPFTARTADGKAFDSDALHGRRVLLKFFRGHW